LPAARHFVAGVPKTQGGVFEALEPDGLEVAGSGLNRVLSLSQITRRFPDPFNGSRK
jgi:hypothetical protein